MEGTPEITSPTPTKKKIQILKDPRLLSCFAKMYFLVSREMLNKCYSHDRSGDGGTHTVTALPGACYHPWPACTPQKSVLRRLWRSKYSLQTQGHAWRLRQPSSAWKVSPQFYVKYASAHSEGWTTVGQLQESRCDLFQQSWGREERMYYQSCNGHRHSWWRSWTKMYQIVEAWTYLKKSNHC